MSDNISEAVRAAAPAGGQMVKSVHLLDFVNQAISTDGTTAMLVFKVAGMEGQPPRDFAITMPVERARWLTGICNEVANEVTRRGKQAGSGLFHIPAQYSVGTAPELDAQTLPTTSGEMMPVGGKIVISFDLGQPTESSFVMMNIAGMAFAQALVQQIMPRLTVQERAQIEKIMREPIAGQQVTRAAQ